MGCRVEELGCVLKGEIYPAVWGLGGRPERVQGSGFRVQGSRVRDWGLWCRGQGLGFPESVTTPSGSRAPRLDARGDSAARSSVHT